MRKNANLKKTPESTTTHKFCHYDTKYIVFSLNNLFAFVNANDKIKAKVNTKKKKKLEEKNLRNNENNENVITKCAYI